MSVEAAIVAGAFTATVGWLYTARRQRTLARKQHTFNALLAMSGVEFENRLARLSPHLREGKLPKNLFSEDGDVKAVLNHFEFLAASIRNGDIYERLLYDSEHGIILALMVASNDYIQDIREQRGRDEIYEHLAWLEQRWTTKKPEKSQRIIEFIVGRPIYDWPIRVRCYLDITSTDLGLILSWRSIGAALLRIRRRFKHPF